MIRPARWTVSPGLVSPEWRWVCRGLVCALPFWETGGDRVSDIVSHQRFWGLNRAIWTPGARGGGPRWTTFDEWKLQDCFPSWPKGNAAMSVFFAGHASVGAKNAVFLIWGERATRQCHGFSMSSAGRFTYFNWGDDLTGNIIVADEQPVTLAATYNGARGKRTYVNGVFDVSSTTGADLNILDNSAGFAPKIGGLQEGTGWLPWDQPYEVLYVWDWALSDAMIAKLHADPFGPLRIADEVPIVFGGVAPPGLLTRSFAVIVG